MTPTTEHETAAAKGFDAEFASRYLGLVDIIKGWTDHLIRYEDADILDFGCGEAITALGFADRLHARSVSAVDIMPDVHRCASRARENLGARPLPANLFTKQIAPGEDFLPGQKFDLIYSWSVFEHIEQPIIDQVIAQLRARLKPDGVLFTQIAPLYYAADGAHLSHRVPVPWGHLSMQDSVYFAKLTEACPDPVERDALWSCYTTLNRLTAPELKRRLDKAGLTLLREYTSTDASAGEPPAELLEIHTREVLVTNQIVLMYRHAAAA